MEVSLYIHWPYCVSKCPYCDFNSHVRDSLDEKAYYDALIKNALYTQSITPYTKLKTIFFGGGTPSLMSPSLVESILNSIQTIWSFNDDIEISLEANPNAVDVQKLKDFKNVGINRLSLGVQSFNPKDLQFLGRSHSLDDALNAIHMARSIYDRFSFDLIYARPKQTMDNWKNELNQAFQFDPTHLSLYQLTIEPETPFERYYKRGDFQLPKDSLSADLYEMTQEMTLAHGLPRYEISNHAKNGQECRHNLTYWRYEDYMGIGPGAHGRITNHEGQKMATRQKRAPETWMKMDLHGYDVFDEVDKDEQRIEQLLMGMRLEEGFDRNTFLSLVNPDRIQKLIDEQLLIDNNQIIKPTSAGFLCLNQVLSYLIN